MADRKLRIGYLAPCFTDEELLVAVRPLLLNYTGDKFEVYCYSCFGRSDGLTAQLTQKVQGLYLPPPGEVADPGELAGRIGRDRVDILVDLGQGRKAYAEPDNAMGLSVLSLRPAPVQIAALGYMNSTGMPYVDFFLGDVYCDPPELCNKYFNEAVLRLPHSLYYYGHTEEGYRAALFRPLSARIPQSVVFGYFGRMEGVDEELLSSWCAILHQVPESRMLFLTSQLEAESVCGQLYAAGISQERLLLYPREGMSMRLYSEVDIVLDAYPQAGLEETCGALYMGVPVISRYGDEHASRLGYSLLMNTGLGELATATAEEYVAKAVALAHDGEFLMALKGKISSMFWNSPVMDGAGYVREVEAAYESAWQQHIGKLN